MKLLHTSDWHVGKAVRGRDRHGEHTAVLAEIASLADTHHVDVVLVAGDLFDSATPSALSERVVYQALVSLARPGRHVVVIAGNHDHPGRLAAVAPLLDATGVHVAAAPLPPDKGGVLELSTSGGEIARLALLPFVSQRHAMNAADLMDATHYTGAQNYQDRIRRIIDTLSAGFVNDAVNVLAAHAFVDASAWGGDGERIAHFIEEYSVPAELFPSSASYVALGHVHRCQQIPAAGPAWYCGSPLRLDFGEAASTPKCVLLIQAEPGIPAAVTKLELSAGKGMRTVEGTLEELAALAVEDSNDDWLRVRVRSPHRAGLADDVRSMFGERAVEIRAEAPSAELRPVIERSGNPRTMFGAYLTERNISDSTVTDLFAELLDGAHAGFSDPDPASPIPAAAAHDPALLDAQTSKQDTEAPQGSLL